MIKKITALVVLLYSFGWAANASAVLFDIAGPSADNVDTDPATVVQLNVAETGSILDINIDLVLYELGSAPDCCYLDNLDITLSHLGMSVLLYPGSFSDTNASEMDAIFDDEAGALAPTSGSVFGTFQPVGSLSVFDGKELSGLWELTIFDHDFPDDGMDLVSWRIFGETGQVPEPATLTLFGLGLAGLVFTRRKKA